MKKDQKFVFDSKTLLFKPRKKQRSLTLILPLIVLMVMGIVWLFNAVSEDQDLSDSSNNHLQTELNKLQLKYEALSQQINKYSSSLALLHQKDANIYKVVYGVTPIDENIWDGGTGGKKLNRSYLDKMWNINVSSIEDKATKLEHQIKLQNNSLDHLLLIARDKENYLKCMPTIIPVQKELLNRDVNLLSGYGKRLHPIFRIWRKHEGIDLTCPEGTDIIAPGNGRVTSVNGHGRGYGNHIVIDHGFGFQTLYAHLSKIIVHEGQKVERGMLIGKVGETGYATAPHLHYEVRKDGNPVNPINYVMDGLSSVEYKALVKQAAIEGKSLD